MSKQVQMAKANHSQIANSRFIILDIQNGCSLLFSIEVLCEVRPVRSPFIKATMSKPISNDNKGIFGMAAMPFFCNIILLIQGNLPKVFPALTLKLR